MYWYTKIATMGALFNSLRTLTFLWMHWDHLAPSCPVALQPRPLCVPPLHPIPLQAYSLSSSRITLLLQNSKVHCNLLPQALSVGRPLHQRMCPVAFLAIPKPSVHPLNHPCHSHPCSLRQSIPARCSNPPQCRHSTPAHRWDNSLLKIHWSND